MGQKNVQKTPANRVPQSQPERFRPHEPQGKLKLEVKSQRQLRHSLEFYNNCYYYYYY